MCVMYILSPERSQMGLHPQISYFTTSPLFSGVSLVIITSIGVDRLLVVTLRLILTIRPTQIFLVNFTGGFRNGLSLFRFMIYVTSVTVSLFILILTLCHMKMYYALHHHQVTVQPHIHQLQVEQRGVNQLNMIWYRNKVIRAFWVQMTVLAYFLSLLIEIILTITGFWT